MDEMRYGLISNYRRSWSIKGERTCIDNQQAFTNRYLYSAIDPIEGENFHMMGFDTVNTLCIDTFLQELKQHFHDDHLVVWDNAAFHKSERFQKDERLDILFLPPYSPQLNPVERFFQEIRKATANQIFESIEAQENRIEKALVDYMFDQASIRQLCGYDWIVQGWNAFCGVSG